MAQREQNFYDMYFYFWLRTAGNLSLICLSACQLHLHTSVCCCAIKLKLPNFFMYNAWRWRRLAKLAVTHTWL